jgi:integrase
LIYIDNTERIRIFDFSGAPCLLPLIDAFGCTGGAPGVWCTRRNGSTGVPIMSTSQLRIARDDNRPSLPKRINFTVHALASITVPAGKSRTWAYDTRAPRLAFMRTSTGASSFYFSMKFKGRPCRVQLGNAAELSIDQARKMADAKYADAIRGIDPMQQKQQDRAEWTFAELFTWYLDTHAKPRKRTWQEDQNQYDLHLQALAPRRFKSIARGDVAKVHASIGAKHPYAANRVLALISTIYSRARDVGFEGTNPAEGIRRFPEQQRERFMQADELPKFFKAMKKVSADWQDYFTLLLLTGARKDNLLAMEWSEISLDNALWTIAAAKFKTNRPMTIVLVPDAVAVLERRSKSQRATLKLPSPFVFPSHSASGHFASPQKAWELICETAGLTDLRIHDLRRTLGSWQAATGASLPIIGKSLGHTQQQTTQIYARLNVDPVRASVGTAVDAMMLASKAKPKKK